MVQMNKRFFLSKSLAESVLNCYKVNLAVNYIKPQRFKDPAGGMIVSSGYFRKYVVVASGEAQARTMLLDEVKDGQVDWLESELEVINESELPEYSLKPEIVLLKPGIVFRSSHFLFP